MANVKITELTELAALDVADNDVLPIVDVGGDTTKKITAASLRTSLAYANDYVTYVQLNSNLNLVQDNVASLVTGLTGANTNIDTVSANVDAQNTYITTNFATLLLLDSVQDNVASAEANVNALRVEYTTNLASAESNVSAVETRRFDNTFYVYNSTIAENVLVSANVEPSSNNTYSLGAPDLVWKDLHVGPGSIFLGDLTLAPNDDATGIVITGADASTTTIDTSVANVTANLNLLQDNVAAAEANVISAETRLNANLDIIQDNVAAIVDATAVETRLNANLDITNDNVTSLTTTVDNFGTYANTNLDTKANVSATYFLALANDYATHTQLSANLDVIQDNVATVTTTVDNFGSYANTTFDTKANVSATLFLARANDFATYSQLNANISVVQDNVTTLTTTVDNFGSYANTNLDTKENVSATYFLALANDFATYTLINANLDIVQDNVATLTTTVDNFGTYANTNLDTKANVSATYIQLDANISVVQDNVVTLTTTVDNFGTSSNANAAALALEDAALQTRLGANVTSLQNEDTALQARIAANALVAASNDYVTYTRLDANVSAVQDNVAAAEANIAAIIDGSTAFTGDVTMNQGLTVSGNLTVVGAQVDLGVSSATIDDAILTLSANLAGDQSPPADTGLLFNRGNQTNVFIGFETADDHLHVVFTDSPGDNVTIAEVGHVDIHANVFHADGGSLDNLPFGPYADNDTGIIFPSADKIGLVTGGAYRANLSSTGLEAIAVYSDGVELRANDYATYTHITANLDIVQDNVAQNATDISAVEARRAANIAGAVSTITTGNLTASRALASDGSGKVAVSAVTSTELGYLDGVTSAIQTQIDSKIATTASAANDYVTYTQLNANINVVQDNVATKLDSASYTASDVLTKIKTVDGAGSGLDADLLDGQSSAYFAVEATRSSNAAALAAGIAGITPIGTSDISDGAVTVGKLAATLDLGALS